MQLVYNLTLTSFDCAASRKKSLGMSKKFFNMLDHDLIIMTGVSLQIFDSVAVASNEIVSKSSTCSHQFLWTIDIAPSSSFSVRCTPAQSEVISTVSFSASSQAFFEFYESDTKSNTFSSNTDDALIFAFCPSFSSQNFTNSSGSSVALNV